MSLRILCDENIPKGVINFLKESEFDVVVVKSETTDLEIAEFAKKRAADYHYI